jgi:hypothetical protein
MEVDETRKKKKVLYLRTKYQSENHHLARTEVLLLILDLRRISNDHGEKKFIRCFKALFKTFNFT